MPARPALLAALASASLVALAGAPAAQAAEGFVGALETGQLVRFQSDAPTGLSTPLRVRGLAPRERLVALAGAPGRLYAIGSTARLYTLLVPVVRAVRPRETGPPPVPAEARAQRIGAPFAQGLRGQRFSLAITPDGRQGQLLSDVGQHLTVDLATGATAEAPPLRRDSDREPAFPAVDTLPDGRLVGVDLARRELLTETAAGAALVGVTPLRIERGADFVGPAGFDIADDGSAWMIAAFGGRRFRPQSILLPVDRAAGATTGPFRPFLRRIVAFTSTGRVPDDTTAPRISVTVPRTVSLRDLVAGRLPFTVVSDEGGQATAWVRFGASHPSAGPALSTRDTPGLHRFKYFFLPSRERQRARAFVGHRVRVTINVDDWAGNKRSFSRLVRLTR